MPLIYKGNTYALPGEGAQVTITGRELISIEDEFGLDGLQLLATLAPDPEPTPDVPAPKPKPGYTRTKALYALAWIAVHRDRPDVTLTAFIDEASIEDIDMRDEENPTDAASSAADSVSV